MIYQVYAAEKKDKETYLKALNKIIEKTNDPDILHTAMKAISKVERRKGRIKIK